MSQLENYQNFLFLNIKGKLHIIKIETKMFFLKQVKKLPK